MLLQVLLLIWLRVNIHWTHSCVCANVFTVSFQRDIYKPEEDKYIFNKIILFPKVPVMCESVHVCVCVCVCVRVHEG